MDNKEKLGFLYVIKTKLKEEGFKQFSSNLASLVAKSSAAMASITAPWGVLTGIIAKTTGQLDELFQVSQRTGIDANFISELGKVASTAGGSFEDTTRNVEQLARAIGQTAKGIGEFQLVFKQYGISVFDAQHKLKSTREVMLDLADVMSKMSETERLGLAQKLGLSGNVVQYLAQGRKALEQQLQDQHKLSLFDKNQAASDVASFNDSLTTLSLRAKEFYQFALLPVIKTLTSTINKVNEWTLKNIDAIKRGLAPVSKALVVLSNVLAAIAGFFAEHIRMVVMATGSLTGLAIALKVVIGLWTVLRNNPIGILVTGLAFAIAYVVENWGKLTRLAYEFFRFIKINFLLTKKRLLEITPKPIVEFFIGVKNITTSTFRFLWSFTKAYYKGLISIFNAAWPYLKKFFEVVGYIVQGIYTLYKPVFDVLAKAFVYLGGILVHFLGEIGKYYQAISKWLQSAGEFLDQFADNVVGVTTSIFERIKSLFVNFKNQLIDFVGNALKTVENTFLNIWGNIKSGFISILSNIRGLYEEFCAFMSKTIGNPFKALKKGFSDVLDSLAGMWTSFINKIYNLFANIAQYITEKFKDIIYSIPFIDKVIGERKPVAENKLSFQNQDSSLLASKSQGYLSNSIVNNNRSNSVVNTNITINTGEGIQGVKSALQQTLPNDLVITGGGY